MCIILLILFVLATILWHLGMKVRCRKRRTWLPCSPIHWDACKRILMVRGMRAELWLDPSRKLEEVCILCAPQVAVPCFSGLDKKLTGKSVPTRIALICADLFFTCVFFALVLFFDNHVLFFPAPYSSTSTMNMFWSFFVTSLAKPGVPEFVLRVFNAKFYSLPWQSFLPTLHNLELMVQVCWISLEFICHGTPLSELVQPRNLSANGTHRCC